MLLRYEFVEAIRVNTYRRLLTQLKKVITRKDYKAKFVEFISRNCYREKLLPTFYLPITYVMVASKATQSIHSVVTNALRSKLGSAEYI